MATGSAAPTLDSVQLGTINKACRRLSELRAAAIAGEVKIEKLSPDHLAQFMGDLELVEAWRERHAGPLRNANANLRHYVRPHFVRNAEIVSVTQRLKKFSTILDKLQRYPTMRLTGMEDIGGVRAVLPTQAAADEVSRRLRKNWKVHRHRDYVRAPKDSGYRAIHLIVVKQGVKIEVQLRTYLQDYWANQVERDSRHLRVDYKSGKGHDAVHAYYVVMSEFMALREAGQPPSQEFTEELRRRYVAAQPYLATQEEES
jgi:putative GTP pyrophosphokinase